ncbi:uncharacterized protein N7482_006923 [Penicillium canariense]|uniref:Uncharacterized protein n=1 Tax=Penicillium canariense TaxID=189055 RepID=A0A9W9LJM7_9EURO|nr:uncharacterized protein N7482_006923 [Penicillium canariense]KAJ5159919.1 hypothetical protein N7482_006923 [Penicillium canariense]
MAIWPFGRKNKRHTIQVSADEATTLQQALDQHDPPAAIAEPTLARKPSRRASKRHNKRLSHGDGSVSQEGSGQTPSSHRPLSSIDHRRLSEADHDRAGPDRAPLRPLSRTGSLLTKQTLSGPNKLRKSKRQTYEILREREIKMLSSTPIDIPRRSTQPAGGDYVVEHRRRKANGRRADRYMSDLSLSIRDSAASSISDISDPFTYKVNAFAALTPRPVVRYVEAPRLPTTRSNNALAGSGRPDRDRLPAWTISEEDLYYSKRRVNELADSLDASTLRELLDRDRRRREKKRVDDQEKLRRKLQERADAQAAEVTQQTTEAPQETQPEIPAAEVPDEVKHKNEIVDEISAEESAPVVPAEQPGTWLQDESKESEAAGRESLESAHVIGNIDDSPMREPKLAPRPSFAPSHELGMSRTTLSPSHSSLRHGVSSPSHSQTFGVGSTSDISEHRPSDTSGRRGGNTITSLFRRGSSRLKRRYKERFQDSSPDVSNASHESFYRIQTQSSPPPPSVIPPRAFIPTGTVKRSQSKFTEHFGDEPLSPPDSRFQSPDIPEQVPESSLENEEGSTFLHGPSPTTLGGMEIVNLHRRRHRSWGESIDAESDNLPLSQSLASIDSEGSWMSGQIFRRMSQKSPGSPVRTMASFSATLDGPSETHDDTRDSVDSHEASSNVMDEPELENDVSADDATKAAETWHHCEVGRRPIVVNPVSRPKSTQGMLKSIPSLSPISAEEDYMDEDVSHPSELGRVASVHGVIGNAEEDQPL